MTVSPTLPPAAGPGTPPAPAPAPAVIAGVEILAWIAARFALVLGLGFVAYNAFATPWDNPRLAFAIGLVVGINTVVAPYADSLADLSIGDHAASKQAKATHKRHLQEGDLATILLVASWLIVAVLLRSGVTQYVLMLALAAPYAMFVVRSATRWRKVELPRGAAVPLSIMTSLGTAAAVSALLTAGLKLLADV